MESKPIEKFYVEGLGKIVVTPEIVFDKGLKLLQENSAELIGLRDLAFARVHAKEKAREYFHSNGTYVKESVFFNYGSPILFFSHSEIIKSSYMLRNAVKAQANKEEIYMKEKFAEKEYKAALEEIGKPPENMLSFILGPSEFNYKDSENNLFIPVEQIGELGFSLWAFKDIAKENEKMLKTLGIEKLPVWLPKQSYLAEIKRGFLRQIWVCCLKGHGGVKGDSGISANNTSLHETSRLIGIVKEA